MNKNIKQNRWVLVYAVMGIASFTMALATAFAPSANAYPDINPPNWCPGGGSLTSGGGVGAMGELFQITRSGTRIRFGPLLWVGSGILWYVWLQMLRHRRHWPLVVAVAKVK